MPRKLLSFRTGCRIGYARTGHSLDPLPKSIDERLLVWSPEQAGSVRSQELESAEEADILEVASKHLTGIAAEPLVQNRCVHRTEVYGELGIAGIVKLGRGQRRLFAIEPAVDCIADDKDRGRRAVIGPVRGVFAGTPSEFGPLEDYDLVAKLVRDEVLMKRVDRVRKVPQQTGMLAGGFAATRNLIRVSV